MKLAIFALAIFAFTLVGAILASPQEKPPPTEERAASPQDKSSPPEVVIVGKLCLAQLDKLCLSDIVIDGSSLSCDILLPSSRTMLYRRGRGLQSRESWPGKYGYLKTSLCRRVQVMVQVSINTLLHFMMLVTTRGCQIVWDMLLFRTATDSVDAKYFMYDTKKSRCRCQPDMDLDVTRKEQSNKISGNVHCVEERTASP